MAEVHINKQAGAKRQLDAAIRILFSGEDELAVHTIAAAVHTVLSDLDDKRGESTELKQVYSEVMKEMREKFPNMPSMTVRQFARLAQTGYRRAANFLKHSDHDSNELLRLSTLKTDNLLLHCCSLYRSLGFAPTKEMETFCRWHLAVYPHEQGDQINTELGPLDKLERTTQIQVGAYLLDNVPDRDSSETD